MTPQERFIKFLEENKALEKFKYNFKYDEDNEDITLDEYLGSSMVGGYVAGAFSWDGTPEGVNYWKDLFFEWRKILSEDV